MWGLYFYPILKLFNAIMAAFNKKYILTKYDSITLHCYAEGVCVCEVLAR